MDLHSLCLHVVLLLPLLLLVVAFVQWESFFGYSVYTYGENTLLGENIADITYDIALHE